jgi:hypothetical protein
MNNAQAGDVLRNIGPKMAAGFSETWAKPLYFFYIVFMHCRLLCVILSLA